MAKPLPVPTLSEELAAIFTASTPPCIANALPTCPASKATAPCRVPGLIPVQSRASPSAAHQATRPLGGDTQFVASWANDGPASPNSIAAKNALADVISE